MLGAGDLAEKLAEKLATFDTHREPHVVGCCNDNENMVVNVLREFVWHEHQDTDDFVLVLKGQVRIDTGDGPVHLGRGQACVIPAGPRHRPVAGEEADLMLIEPAGTPNTGDPTTAAVKTQI